jgi:hypothetical protein
MPPDQILRVHYRVKELATSLNARTLELLRTRWMPLPREVRARHAALHIPTALT